MGTTSTSTSTRKALAAHVDANFADRFAELAWRRRSTISAELGRAAEQYLQRAEAKEEGARS